MFVDKAINRNIDMNGEIVYSPLLRVILRVLEDSYIELADAKRHDEVRPWETIISKAPSRLQQEIRNRLNSNRPIWLTDA